MNTKSQMPSNMNFTNLVDDILSAKFDSASSGIPKHTLLLCTTPRTGGHTCCKRLLQLGAGVPTEYFQPQFALRLARRLAENQRLQLTDLQQYASTYGTALRKYRTKNSVFAAKIFLENYEFCRRSIGPENDKWRYLRLVRRDKVAQTISLLCMLRTGRPFDSDQTLENVVMLKDIGSQSVANAVKYLQACEKKWDVMLAHIPAERRALIYTEDLLQSSATTFEDALAKLLPATDLDRTGAIVPTKKYAVDAELKAELWDEYSAQIEGHWQGD